MKILTEDFGNISSLADLNAIFGSVVHPINYFTNRGYTADVNIRAAAYDWRLGAGKKINYYAKKKKKKKKIIINGRLDT